MPCYNEESSLDKIIKMVMDLDLDKELIVVNDASTDKSALILETLKNQFDDFTVLTHDQNLGKGSAIRTAIPYCKGEIITIQDADLETNPSNLQYLIKPIFDQQYDVVYGSRILGYSGPTNNLFYFGGRLVTSFCNLLYGTSLTDEPTCYKLFKADVLKSIKLNCKRFEFCPEVTAKISKKRIAIKELPMDYYPRSKKDGKKLSYFDGIHAIWTLIKYRFID